MTFSRNKVGELVRIVKGRKAPVVFSEWIEGSQRYIQIDDLRPGANPVYAKDASGKQVGRDDLLIAWDGANAGTVSYGIEGIAGSTIAILQPVSKGFHTPYLGRYLQSKFDYFQWTSNGATIPHLSRRALEELVVPLPPLAEQRRIAAMFDKVDELRALRWQALARLDDLAQSVFFEMFGDPVRNNKKWRSVSIGDICYVKGGKRLPKGHVYSTEPTPYRYLRVTDFKSGTPDANSLNYLGPETFRKISNYTVSKGDVVISIAGTIGATLPIGDALHGVSLTENAAKLVPKVPDEYTANFLSFVLRLPHLKSQIDAQTGQVTIGKLALFRIERIKLFLPTITAQREFDHACATINQLKIRCQNSMQKTSFLANALTQQFFAS